jgi:alkanesulfonate monooxygenase SsuD/methylene tetrahydromethanopterin reductase-like flavin-dependent oxidoreductase (luciferase family)
MLFQNPGNLSDAEVYAAELKLARVAEPAGFDSLWCVEHHFTDYTMCPDVTQFLSYMAGCTSRIKLGTGAVILPWHDPLRVAEEIALLDYYSDGRTILGMGRGLARLEYEGFREDMNQSRTKFNEAAEMIVSALETGFAEYDGEVVKQPRVEIRPRPPRSFEGRLFSVAMSPDSIDAAAELGTQIMLFMQRPIEDMAAEVNRYREQFRAKQGREPGSVLCNDFIICDDSAERAEEMARKYTAAYFLTAANHYEMAGSHSYGDAARMLQEMGLDKVADAFVDLQIWGTPQQIFEKLETRRKILGDFQLNGCFSFAGMPYDYAERSMKLYGARCIPELHSWTSASAA